jgi:hypothetical protein
MYSNQTTYSEDKLRQFSHFSYKTKLIPYLLIVETIFLVVIISTYFISEFAFITSIAIFIMMPFALALSHKLKQKHIYKNSPSLKHQPVLRYIFEEDYIVIEHLDESESKAKVRYSDIFLGSEDLFNFYLYPNPVSAYIIDKKGFQDGNIEDIKIYLKAKLNKTKFNKKSY